MTSKVAVRNWVGVLLTLVVAAGSLTSCIASNEETGRVAATRYGQISSRPVPNMAFDAELRDACGTPATLDALGAMTERDPYLQQVDDDSAMVMWTSRGNREMTLELTTPAGEPVVTALSSIEDTTYLRNASQHVAMVDGLEPSTIYCYSLAEPGGRASERIGFRTAPAAGSGEPLYLLAVGDMGTGSEDQTSVFDQIRSVPFDLMLPLGDNAYESGRFDEFEENFFAMYAPVLRSISTLPVSGNHEYHTDDAAPFREMFALPRNGGDAGLERWYSFDYGDVHFVALDTELVNDAQRAWLERDLAENDKPWTIVMAHRPPYSSGHHGSFKPFRDAFGDILSRHEVPLVLSGHEHSYERTEVIDGTVYVVSGGGGRETRDIGSSDFTAFSEEVLHFLWIEIDGDMLVVHAVDATGNEFDSVEIWR